MAVGQQVIQTIIARRTAATIAEQQQAAFEVNSYSDTPPEARFLAGLFLYCFSFICDLLSYRGELLGKTPSCDWSKCMSSSRHWQMQAFGITKISQLA